MKTKRSNAYKLHVGGGIHIVILSTNICMCLHWDYLYVPVPGLEARLVLNLFVGQYRKVLGQEGTPKALP